MITDILTALLRANLAGAAAILVVLALRKPVRRLFGAQQAYGLWVLAPLACLAVLLPARQVLAPALAAPPAPVIASHLAPPVPAPPEVVASAVNAAASRPPVPVPDVPQLILGAWLVGVGVGFALLAWRQRRFLATLGPLRHVERGDGRLLLAEGAAAGPALVGALFPRVIVPGDFERRFTPAEQVVVLAHEQTHLARQDARANGLLALAQCLNWFNPLLHVGAYFIRLDQELACDAAVMASLPGQRRCYAEALLKTQMTKQPLPLGCYWPARSRHPLEERIAMLKQPSPGAIRRLAGAASVLALSLGLGLAAWASQPPQVVAPGAPPQAAAQRIDAPQIAPSQAAPVLKLAEAGPAAPDASDAAGDWIGSLKVMGLRIALHIRKGDDGAYQGELDSPDQGAYGIKMDKVAVGDGALSFTIAALKAQFDGKWDPSAHMWIGQWAQLGLTWPLAISRGTFPPAPTFAGFDGDWDGKLNINGVVLRLAFHIHSGVHGTLAVMDSPDQNLYGLPTSISRQGDHVVLGMKAIDMTIAGDLSGDGQAINATFTQRGGSMPLVLTRPAPGAAPAPPPSTDADRTDFSGEWRVSGLIEANGQAVLAKPTCVFQQAGARLTGTCKGPNSLGTATGTVDGRRLSWRWDATPSTPIGANGVESFDGTLGPDGVVRGATTYSGLPGATGTFTQQRP